MSEQQENPVHDRETCGGPATCPYCSPPKDVINVIKAIKLARNNIPVIAETTGLEDKWSLAYIIDESDLCYLVITPRDKPQMITEAQFKAEYRFASYEKPGEFSEVVPR